MKQRKVLILGGSSDIGIEAIKLFLKNNWKVTAHFNSRKINLGINFTNGFTNKSLNIATTSFNRQIGD